MGIILRTQKMAAGHAAAAFHKHCIKLHSASGQACASATLPRATARTTSRGGHRRSAFFGLARGGVWEAIE
jgi:hypothetical protein